LTNLLENMRSLDDRIIDIQLVGTNGNSITLRGAAGIQDQPALPADLPERSSAWFSGLAVDRSQTAPVTYMTAALRVYSIDPNRLTNRLIGTLTLMIDARGLLGLGQLTQADSRWQIYLLDRDSQIVADASSFADVNLELAEELHSRLSSIQDAGPVIFRNEPSWMQLKAVPVLGMTIVTVQQQEILRSSMNRLTTIHYLTLTFVALLLSATLYLALRNLLQPVNRLVGTMQLFNSGNRKVLKERVELPYVSPELRILTDSFNHMLQEIDSLTHSLSNTYYRMYEMELEKKQSELSFLRSQINPHFLYNTLESIKGLASDSENPFILEITHALAEIFRYSVRGGPEVRLQEEIEMVRAYMRIQTIRFEDRFQVLLQFEQDIMDCIVPKMILQPLIENAISHGLEQRMEPGLLQVGGRLDEQGNLLIWVEDNGAGMDEATLQQIRRTLQEKSRRLSQPVTEMILREDQTPISPDSDQLVGIGLVNVHHRLALMFGGRYGLDINSSLNKGTRVELRLPAERSDQNVSIGHH
jgi:two-component system sensor histidine kinase YesM